MIANVIVILFMALLYHAQCMSIQYPIKIKSIISKLTQTTQLSLQKQMSRISIELPPGVEFGVETSSSIAKSSATPSQKNISSNREIARLLAEMFSTLSSTSVVLFPTETEANNARNLWGKTYKGKVLSIDVPDSVKGYGKLRSRKFSLEEQEQALFQTDGVYVPDDTEVLIIAGPRMKDYKKISIIHDKFDDGTLIILINPRVAACNVLLKDKDSSDVNMKYVQLIGSLFTNTFHYAPPAVATDATTDKELLLYHEINGSWSIAVKGTSKG